MIKRYDFTICTQYDTGPEVEAEESLSGEYVRYEDYDKLQNENDRLKTENKALKDLMFSFLDNAKELRKWLGI